MSVFKDKTLLITGGTGSFGNAVLRRFLDSDIKEIRIFSRDEKKQDDMRHFLQAQRPDVFNKVKFYIGNVRQREAVDFAMQGVDYVFSAAALKQVPSWCSSPHGSRKNQCGRYKQCPSERHSPWREECRCAFNRQSCLSHQCHGHLQGHDGESRHCPGTCPWRRSCHHHLLHTLRQCDGKPRFRHPALGGADDGRQAHHHHRPQHDTLHDDTG